MRLIRAGSVMKLTTRISPPQRGHTSGSTSYTRRIRLAHRRLRAARSGGVGTASSEVPLEAWAPSCASALRRLPRAAFE